MNNDDILNYFRDAGALLEGHFVLSSGYHSGMYLQCAKIFMNPIKSEYLCKILADKIKTSIDLESVDLIISPAMGGVIIGYEIARQLKKNSIFLERVDGVFNLRRGFKIIPGMRVLILEDVITTGKSSLECMHSIEKNGGVVIGLACLVDRTTRPVVSSLEVISLLKLDIAIYKPEDIPSELKKITPIKPGSRGLL